MPTSPNNILCIILLTRAPSFESLQWYQSIDMQKILRNGSVLSYSAIYPPCIAQIQRRFVSRNTAIERGLRQGFAAAYEDRRERPWLKRESQAERPQKWAERPNQREHDVHGSTHPYRKQEEDSPLGFNNRASPPGGRHGRAERRPPSPTKSHDYRGPISIPYTTAASEFLYGYNPVRAALKAQRRKLYKVYLHPRVASRDGDTEVASIRRLAEEAKVEIVDVNDSWLKVMDKMSDDRPHNVKSTPSQLWRSTLTPPGLCTRSIPPPPTASASPRSCPKRRDWRRTV
jgi:hypothetical protein